MKKIIIFLALIIIVTSCTSTKVDNSLEPLWFDDSYEYLSSSKYIVFKAKGSTITEAYNIIKQDADYLSNYIEPKKEKEYTNNNGYTYLIYSIKKSDLESAFKSQINEIYSSFTKYVVDGDSTSSILDKLSFYEKALFLYKKVIPIEEFAKSLDIYIDSNNKFNLDDINQKITFTREQIVFTVNVDGDINGSIKSLISQELHKKGYKTSLDGIIVIDAKLNLNPVKLNNEYVNKYWDLQLTIGNIYGDNRESLSFNGRESQITNDSLDQLIVRVASKKILDSLVTILP